LPGDGIPGGRSGYLPAHFSPRVSQRAMRWSVAAVGFLTAAYFFARNALQHE
jgi:hypothetical protein